MIAEIKLYCNKETKKGFPVVFYYRNKEIRKRVALGWYFFKHEWNFETKEPFATAKDYRYIYPVLLNYKHQIKHLLFTGETDLNAYLQVLNKNTENEIILLKKRIAELQNESKINLIQFMDVLINEKNIKKESTAIYTTTKNQLNEFLMTDIPMNDVTYEWLNGFILYKKAMGTGIPGINAYLQVIRATYKEAQRRSSLQVKKDNPFIGLIKKFKYNKSNEVTPDDFLKLQQFKPHKNANKSAAFTMQRVIDLWLFQFVIGGHDLVDVALLTWENYKNGRLKFQRYKNRNKPDGGIVTTIKVLPFAKRFIQKYGAADGERIFEFITDPTNETRYTTFRGNYNRSLKTISAAQQLTSILKSKTSRYVFAAYAGELLIHTHIIDQIQGRKSLGVVFAYQGKLPTKVIDLHHNLIIEKAGLS